MLRMGIIGVSEGGTFESPVYKTLDSYLIILRVSNRNLNIVLINCFNSNLIIKLLLL